MTIHPITLLVVLAAPVLALGCAQIIGADFDHPRATATGSGGGGRSSSSNGGGGATSSSSGASGCTSDDACPDPGECMIKHCDVASGTCKPQDDPTNPPCTSVPMGVCSDGLCAGPCKHDGDCVAADCRTVTCQMQHCVYTDDPTQQGKQCADPTTYCDAHGQCVDQCDDGKRDGNEMDIDCGGGCSTGCPNGTTCQGGTDCASGHCNGATCSAWATAVAVGGSTACALTSYGVKCWGYGQDGELGNGATSENVDVPVGVLGVGAGAGDLTAGGLIECVIASGGLTCWGWERNGEIDGTNGGERSSAIVAQGLSSGLLAGAIGSGTGCAINASHGLSCWCDAVSGACGNGSAAAHPTPVAVSGLASGVSAVAVGNETNCALTSGGGVKCWGSNYVGQCGDGSLDHGGACGSDDCSPSPVTVTGLTNATSVSVSTSGGEGCATTSNQTVMCWGLNNHGQLGDGATHADCNGNGSCSASPVTVSGLNDATAVSVGGLFACALTASHGVKCWGQNNEGQLGDGTTNDSSTPVDVVGLTDATAIAAGGTSACALTTSGGVKCWGDNSAGELGNGSSGMQKSTPVLVVLP